MVECKSYRSHVGEASKHRLQEPQSQAEGATGHKLKKQQATGYKRFRSQAAGTTGNRLKATRAKDNLLQELQVTG
jgi:hypothetical protein